MFVTQNMWETTHSGVKLWSDCAKENVKVKIVFDVCHLLFLFFDLFPISLPLPLGVNRLLKM